MNDTLFLILAIPGQYLLMLLVMYLYARWRNR